MKKILRSTNAFQQRFFFLLVVIVMIWLFMKFHLFFDFNIIIIINLISSVALYSVCSREREREDL